MKSTGIIMSGDHPVKIMDGIKTQIRRTYGLERVNKNPDYWLPGILQEDGRWLFISKNQRLEYLFPCPYGGVSDQLWVRETHAFFDEFPGMPSGVGYRADIDSCGQVPVGGVRRTWDKIDVRPSIYMFKKDSRITLTITDIRPERLQDITNEDAAAEGAKPMTCCLPGAAHYITPFKELWDSLNAKRGYSWESNPWVWVIKFGIMGARLK